MSDFTRVRDPESGHEFSMATAAVPDGYQVLDEDAVDPSGRPLPPKYAAPREIESMTKAELADLAAARGVDLGGATTKADMVAAIQNQEG